MTLRELGREGQAQEACGGTGHRARGVCAQQGKQQAISCLRWQRGNATSLGFAMERNSLLLPGGPCPQTYQAGAGSEQPGGVPVPSPAPSGVASES